MAVSAFIPYPRTSWMHDVVSRATLDLIIKHGLRFGHDGSLVHHHSRQRVMRFVLSEVPDHDNFTVTRTYAVQFSPETAGFINLDTDNPDAAVRAALTIALLEGRLTTPKE